MAIGRGRLSVDEARHAAQTAALRGQLAVWERALVKQKRAKTERLHKKFHVLMEVPRHPVLR